MKKSLLTVISGIAAEILFAFILIAIGLIIAWICFMVRI
jgi:hypothetical protein